MRFHVGPEEGIDARLIAGALGFEPLQHLLIQPDGDRRLRLRQLKDRALEEGVPLLRDIGGIDGPVFERINSLSSSSATASWQCVSSCPFAFRTEIIRTDPPGFHSAHATDDR
jgi:hypothetical protein